LPHSPAIASAKLKNAIEEKMVQSELSESYKYRLDKEE